MALTTKITARLRASLTGSGDHGTPQVPIELAQAVELASGTGSGQADKVFSDQRTITASSSEDLDLAGVLIDLLGATITFVKIKAIMIKAAAANVNNVVVGAAASNQFVGPFGASTHTKAIAPGGFELWFNPSGWTVSAGSGDLLKIANSGSGSSVVYDIVIIGTSA